MADSSSSIKGAQGFFRTHQVRTHSHSAVHLDGGAEMLSSQVSLFGAAGQRSDAKMTEGNQGPHSEIVGALQTPAIMPANPNFRDILVE